MNAIIYFSVSKNKHSKKVAESLEGDVFEIKPTDRVYKSRTMQILMYGFKTVANRAVDYQIDDIDFDKYDLITLVTPVWAGRISQYMRKYLESVPFKNKEVVLVGTSEGGYKNFFKHYKEALDSSNNVLNEIIYVNGEKVK